MKLIEITCLVDAAGFTRTPAWGRISGDVRQAIEAIHWPPDSSIFTIHPQSGKKRGQGNGVKPIKEAFVLKLLDLGWKPEQGYPRGEDAKQRKFWPGAFDAWLDLSGQIVSDGPKSEDREAQNGQEEAEDFCCDPEVVPAAGPVYGGTSTATERRSSEGQGDTRKVGGAGGDRGGERMAK